MTIHPDHRYSLPLLSLLIVALFWAITLTGCSRSLRYGDFEYLNAGADTKFGKLHVEKVAPDGSKLIVDVENYDAQSAAAQALIEAGKALAETAKAIAK